MSKKLRSKGRFKRQRMKVLRQAILFGQVGMHLRLGNYD